MVTGATTAGPVGEPGPMTRTRRAGPAAPETATAAAGPIGALSGRRKGSGGRPAASKASGTAAGGPSGWLPAGVAAPVPPMLDRRRPDGGDWTRAILQVLSRCYGVHVVGWVGCSWRVTHPADLHNREWYVTDNGGELGVHPVNDPAPREDVPTYENTRRIDPGTAAYRIACRLQGDPIDYGERCPELVELLDDMAPGHGGW